MIYLDNAATTFIKPECVYEAMDNASRNLSVNAGRGLYKKANEATKLIDSTRKSILKLVKASENFKVSLAPSITIALNQILNGLDFEDGDIVYVSPYEHNAVMRTLNLISKKVDLVVKELPLLEDSLEIDVDKSKYLLMKDKPKCICLNHMSNVTGYVIPIKEIFEIARENGIITLLDSAQSLGLIDIQADSIGANFIAFTSHKSLYGPFGIAGFISDGKVELSDFIVGGTGSDSMSLDMPLSAEGRYESASPNIYAISGLKASLEWINVEEVYQKERSLTDYLVNKLSNISSANLYLPGNKDNHIGVVSFNIEGYRADEVGNILDEDFDIAIRTGYHCTPNIHKYLKNEQFGGTVRASLGYFNSTEDIDKLCEAIGEL